MKKDSMKCKNNFLKWRYMFGNEDSLKHRNAIWNEKTFNEMKKYVWKCRFFKMNKDSMKWRNVFGNEERFYEMKKGSMLGNKDSLKRRN